MNLLCFPRSKATAKRKKKNKLLQIARLTMAYSWWNDRVGVEVKRENDLPIVCTNQELTLSSKKTPTKKSNKKPHYRYSWNHKNRKKKIQQRRKIARSARSAPKKIQKI